MNRIVVALALMVTAAAWGQGAQRHLASAAKAVENARVQARRTVRCQAVLAPQLDSLSARIAQQRRTPRDEDVTTLKLELASAAFRAPRVGCSLDVAEHLERAVDALEETRWSEKSRRRHPRRAPDARPEPMALMSPLDVQPNAQWDNEGAVRVAIPELQLHDLQGTVFYLGARFRSLEGDWTDWVTTQTWSVPNQAFVWKNAFNHYFRYSTLAEDDFSGGRFIAHLAVFTADGRTLAFREVPFRVRLPQAPLVPTPPLPEPMAMARDCGAGLDDPGCGQSKDGRWPMDGVAYSGMLVSLQATSNELVRAEMCETIVRSQVITARQLEAILKLFNNELTRLDVARALAPKVVNPQHALGLAATFRNSFNAQEFTELMAAQTR